MSDLVFNLPNTILLVACVYGLTFASVLIIRNRSTRNAHFWLGVFLFTFSFCLIDTYLKLIYLDVIFPPVDWTYYRLLTLIPYTLWIYISYLIAGQFRIGRFEKALLSCVAIEVIFRIYSFVISAIGWKEWAEYNNDIIDVWIETLIILVVLLTLAVAFQEVRNYQEKLENNYSERTEKDLIWLKELLFVLFMVTIIWVLVVPIDFFFLREIDIPLYWVLLPQALIVFYFGIKGHLQPEIFHEFPLIPSFEHNKSEEEAENTIEDSEYKEVSTATNEYMSQLLLIEKIMKEDKLYRQPKLSLQDMAKKLDLNTRQLSKLINQHYQCSFSDFVNQYRVEEVKENILTRENEQFTLLALALEAGFNSKSSFNYMFKKFTGQTPIQFKNTRKS